MKNFGGEGSKVTWASNWHSDRYVNQKGQRVSLGQYNEALEYVPQLWNVTFATEFDHNMNTNMGLAKRGTNAATNVFAFNEPNQCGGGGTCMTNRTDVLVESYKQTLQKYGKSARLGAPSVTNGADGISWLRGFMEKCSDCQIDFVQAHWYGAAGHFIPYMEQFHGNFTDNPIWLTEFAIENAPEKEQMEFLKMAMDFMDKKDYIERYAFFMAKPLGDSRSLVNEDGSLTEIGRLYNSG